MVYDTDKRDDANALISGGFYIVSYALAIYLLNLLIGFLTPKFEPDDSLNIDEEAGWCELDVDSLLLCVKRVRLFDARTCVSNRRFTGICMEY